MAQGIASRPAGELSRCVTGHIHAYSTRFVPPITGGVKPRFCQPEGGEEFRTAPYPPYVTRDWLLRPADQIADTFGNTASALAWFQQWLNDNPRPEACWAKDDPQHGASPSKRPCWQRYEQRLRDHAPAGSSWPLSGLQHKVAYIGLELAGGRDAADGFYTATEHVSAHLVLCPAAGYPCPLSPS